MQEEFKKDITVQSLIRKIASARLCFCSLRRARQRTFAIYSYECQHSTSIRQGSWLCIVAILHKFYIRRYCILHKHDKVKIETENVKYVM